MSEQAKGWTPEAINPEELGEPIGPFSRAIRVGPWLFVSGTTALSQATGDYYSRKVPEGIEAQATQTLDNLQTVLHSVGATLDDVIKVTVMIKDPQDYPAFNRI